MGTIPDFPSWPANETETLLEAACRDPAQCPGFYRSLRSCKLVVLPDPQNPPVIENGRIKAGEQLRLRTIEVEGVHAIIAVTSTELLDRLVPKGTPFLEFRGEDLFRVAAMDPVVINPSGPFGKLLTSDEIRVLLTGFVPGKDGVLVAEEEIPVRFAQLASPPPHLLAELRRACRRCKDIKAAYVGLVNYPGAGDESVVLVGVVSDGDSRAAARAIGEAAPRIPDLPHGKIDIADVTRADEGSFEYLVQSTGLKFYTRSWWRGLLRP